MTTQTTYDALTRAGALETIRECVERGEVTAQNYVETAQSDAARLAEVHGLEEAEREELRRHIEAEYAERLGLS